MKNIIFQFTLIMISLSACCDSSQYDVYVHNGTSDDIRIEYKTMKDKDGPIERSINLKSGAQIRIISTVELNSGRGYSGTSADYCYLVADYIRAYKSGNVQSSLAWCGDEVRFNTVDMCQGEFYLEYSDTHF